MRSAVSALVLALAAGSAWAQTPPEPPVAEAARADPANWPRAASPEGFTDAATEAFISDLMARMTVEEKVGQLIQADIASIRPEDLRTWPIGSILAGGNSSPGGDERAPAEAWVALARAFREANAARPGTSVPLIYGIDAVHGHNNVVGATIFPHNIGLGAARERTDELGPVDRLHDVRPPGHGAGLVGLQLPDEVGAHARRRPPVGQLGGGLLLPVLPEVTHAELGQQVDVAAGEELRHDDQLDLVTAAAGGLAGRGDPPFDGGEALGQVLPAAHAGRPTMPA